VTKKLSASKNTFPVNSGDFPNIFEQFTRTQTSGMVNPMMDMQYSSPVFSPVLPTGLPV